MIILLCALLFVCLLYYLAFWNDESRKCDKKLKKESKKFNVINPNLPPQNFLLTDDNGNISTMNFGTTNLNSNMTVNGDIYTSTIKNKDYSKTMIYSDQNNTYVGGNNANYLTINNSGNTTVNGNITTTGDLNSLKNINFTQNWKNTANDTTSEISNDTGTFKKLMIVGNNNAGGSRKVGIWDDLDVYGTLCVEGRCLTGNDIRRLKDFLDNIPTIKENLYFLQQRGGVNDSNATMNGIGGNSNSKWAACLSEFFKNLRTGFDI